MSTQNLFQKISHYLLVVLIVWSFLPKTILVKAHSTGPVAENSSGVVLAQVPPTSEPTVEPTITPTPVPLEGQETTEPTEEPAPEPTPEPTIVPTVAPTNTPLPTATLIPTQIPTTTPVPVNTEELVKEPTPEPTQTTIPTIAPTSTPMVEPTATIMDGPTPTPPPSPSPIPPVMTPTLEPTTEAIGGPTATTPPTPEALVAESPTPVTTVVVNPTSTVVISEPNEVEIEMIEVIASYEGRPDTTGLGLRLVGPIEREVPIDHTGRFLLDNLADGSYNLIVDAQLYLPSCTTIFVENGQVDRLNPVSLVGGDTDDNNKIGINDATLIGSNFGLTTSDPSMNPRADINADGQINILDLSILGGNFGKQGCQQWPQLP